MVNSISMTLVYLLSDLRRSHVNTFHSPHYTLRIDTSYGSTQNCVLSVSVRVAVFLYNLSLDANSNAKERKQVSPVQT